MQQFHIITQTDLWTELWIHIQYNTMNISLWSTAVKHFQWMYVVGVGGGGSGGGARLIIVNANLYLIHRGITWINFHIIQPVVVLVIDPHLPELNCCLISQRTGWRGLADSIWKRTWGRHERIFSRDFVKVSCQFVIHGHLLFLPYFFFFSVHAQLCL